MNNAIDIIFDLAVNLYQGIVFVVFTNLFLTPRFRKRTNIILCAIAVTALFVAITALNHIFQDMVVFEIFWFMIIMVPFSVFCHKGKLALRILMPIMMFALLISVSMTFAALVSAVFSLNHHQLITGSHLYNYMLVFVVNAVYLFVLYHIYRVYHNKISIARGIDIVNCFIVPILTIISVMLLTLVIADSTTTEINRLYISGVVFILFLIAFSMFAIMRSMTRSAEVAATNRALEREQEMYREQIVIQNEFVENVSGIRHEMNNRLLCIAELLRQGNTDEAAEMCERIQQENRDVTTVYRTENVYLNAVLNMIQKKSEEQGCRCTINVKSNLSEIDGSDLISLLGNLCDNALDALRKTENGILSMTLFEKGNYYMISVTNTVAESVLERNPRLLSTKQDKSAHGHGLRIIRRIVVKYSGNVSLSEDGGMFSISIMLERPAKKTESEN